MQWVFRLCNPAIRDFGMDLLTKYYLRDMQLLPIFWYFSCRSETSFIVEMSGKFDVNNQQKIWSLTDKNEISGMLNVHIVK